ncbi:MAG: insulinase family protein [Acidobacteriota bacterium]|nr:insulinase family protein [Acidobacteriota bacterium]
MKFRGTTKLFCSVLFLLSFLLTTDAQNNPLPNGVERVAAVEGVTEYRLQNGLRVLLSPDQTAPKITVNVTYLVGSKHENYGETGMAHLLEHLFFKGSPKHPKQDAEGNLHGARLNGTTDFDRTNYIETFPATDDNLNWALSMESDRMANAYILKKDLDSEFSVVRNEFERGENSPFTAIYGKFLSSAYQWHNYGNTVIGAKSDLENVPIERVQAFFKTFYQPDNAVLIISGKFDEPKTVELVNKYFGAIPKPARTLPKSYTTEPTQDGEREVWVRRVGDTQYIMAGYHLPPAAHADFGAVELLWQILGNPNTGRLRKNLVETKKAASLFGSTSAQKEPGFGFFYVEMRKEMSLDAARSALIETIANLASNPPTTEEVGRARNNILKNVELNLTNSEAVADLLSEAAAAGDWRLAFLYRDKVKKATLEDVRRVAQTYLKPANRTIAYFVPTEKPDRSEIPSVSETELAALTKDYKGGTPPTAGEPFDSSPANIEARVKRATVGGLKTAFLPKENRGDTVVASLNLDFGDEKGLMNRTTAANFTAQMLLRGTTKRTRQQIQDELDKLRARVNIFGSAEGAMVSIETIRGNLPAVMRLVGEILREPAFAESEFEQVKQEYLAQIESQKSEPTAIAQNKIQRHFNKYAKGHPLYTSTFDEQISEANAVKITDLRQFHKDFYGASNGELSIVGDFDPKEMTAVTTEIFGNWKSAKSFARINRQYNDIAVINENIETPDKTNSTFEARLDLKMRDDDPDYPALALANFILGSGFTSRLTMRLREKEGLSYNVGSRFFAHSLDPTARFNISAIFAPQNVEKVEAAYKEELARFVKDGVTAEEMTDAKAGLIERFKVNRSQDAGLARTLNNYLFNNRTFAWDAEFEKKIAALTPEQVNAAIRKYFTPDKIIIIKAGDFAGAKAKMKTQ